MSTHNDRSLDKIQTNLIEIITAQRARRTVLKGAVAGLASLSALGAHALVRPGAVFAYNSSRSKLQHILDIAVTVEQLAVTTYGNGVANASTLGISGNKLKYLQAALVEEQIHEIFFESMGAQPLTSTFSYPNGDSTFTNLSTFIEAQQQLEEIFASVYLIGVVEVAQLNQYRLAQILAQTAGIESEHRVLGRVIEGSDPADNYAYTPVLIKQVEDAPSVLSAEGYLSPVPNNTYTYERVSTKYHKIEYHTPYVTTSNLNSYGGYGKSNQPGPGGSYPPDPDTSDSSGSNKGGSSGPGYSTPILMGF
ncbi:ferritin-like domain-containing protein [Dictyobacter formicarum]|nr:ferritin-like domain-containing protein [Dictyobacter formicarum]